MQAKYEGGNNVVQMQRPANDPTPTAVTLVIPLTDLEKLRKVLTSLSATTDLALVVIDKAGLYGDAAAFNGVAAAFTAFIALAAQLIDG